MFYLCCLNLKKIAVPHMEKMDMQYFLSILWDFVDLRKPIHHGLHLLRGTTFSSCLLD